MRIWVYLGITALGLWFWAAASLAAFAAEPALWSLRKPARPELPPVEDKSWPRNPIDRFILAALEAAGLSPSPQADRRTLIRRLSLDLTGLPPSPAEVEAFIADPDPAAYEKLADRLLASPRYGERWGQHWLDLVKFAETDGFETNTPRPHAWPYRDWVIGAFNDDKPYDQFVREQLAGDRLGAAAATGFLTAGPYDQVKSPDLELTLQQRMDELNDMISAAGAAFLGLTVGCARCHDHKFDPISMKDYYALQAVFAGVNHGNRELETAEWMERQKELPPIEKELAEVNAKLGDAVPLAALPLSGPPEQRRPPISTRYNADRFPTTAARFVRFTVLKTSGLEPCLDELEIYGPEDPSRNLALASAGARASASSTFAGSEFHQLEHLNDGRYGNGRSWISQEPGGGWVEIELPEARAIDRVVWSRDRDEVYQDRLAIEYRIEIKTEPGKPGRFTTVATHADRRPYAPGAKPEPDATAAGLEPEPAKKFSRLEARRRELAQKIKALVEKPKLYAGLFREPEATHLLHRGDPLQKREPVPPGAIAAIPPRLELPAEAPESERRLALAEWIVNPENPLPARVLANRLWQHHFGEGLVSTPSDFGANGARPTHPLLLDWLAAELVERGWSIKHVQRLIVGSSAYRQASFPDSRKLAIDAASRLLWRFPPRRLEAEAIRDAVLCASGRLDLRAGGPGYSVFEPNDNYVRVYNPRKEFGPSEWRRMVYQFKARMQQDSTFGAFDCPDAGQLCSKRTRSTTAIQSLNLLNSPFMLQQAGFFAERLAREAGKADAGAQARLAFRLACSREPDGEEAAASAKFIGEHGLPAFCRALYNTSEFLFFP